MCVIVFKPQGAKAPTVSQLKACFEHNPHGAGYMLPVNGKVLIRKGFMSYSDFQSDLVATIKRNGLDPLATPIVFHFRITTQGGVHKEICHPFPVCRSYKTMRKLNQTCEMGLAHNGIISLCSESSYSWHWNESTGKHERFSKPEPNHNDTMTFIKDYASLILGKTALLTPEQNELLLRLSKSKLAIMDGEGNVSLVGKYTKRDGCYYSNEYSFPTGIAFNAKGGEN